MKYMKIAAAAIVRYEFEKPYRALYREKVDKKGYVPFGILVGKLVKARLIPSQRRSRLQKWYNWLSKMIHA